MDDPIPGTLPGDTDTISRFARTYHNTAEALEDAARELSALANANVTISDAVDEVREKARSANATTLKVAERYEGASSTLHTFANQLGSAQDRANTARNTIDSNNDNYRYWRNRRMRLIMQANVAAATDPDFPADLKEANLKVNEATANYQIAMGQYNTAVTDRNNAINQAINSLETVASEAGLNDDFWEGIQGMAQQLYELAQKYLAPLIEKLREILEFIKSIVDILALVFTILALFIPALAPLALILVIASVALSAMILICSLVLFALGKESIGRVLADTIGLVISIVGAAVGGGAILGTAGSLAGSTGSTVVKTIFDVALNVGDDLLIDIAGDTAQHIVETGLDVTVDQFPNANGLPVGTEGVLQSPDGSLTWDLNTFTDPEAHTTFIIDQMLGNSIPFYSEVSDYFETGMAVGGYEDFTISHAIYDGIAAS